ncbi:MAG TPA: 50S ribosomal protein L35 [Candidatus Eisenbacteria bacterium]|jgi:large subunit ribosomal protein L35|nr:50S ribosomal protein L35 [Candidatus Eisenbacteria bacterium]
MPKMKTSRATAKRLKRTGTGKIKRGRAGGRHHLGLKGGKSRKRKRKLHTSTLVEHTERYHMQKLLPYGD